jgi:hypothetical protein
MVEQLENVYNMGEKQISTSIYLKKSNSIHEISILGETLEISILNSNFLKFTTEKIRLGQNAQFC